MSNEQPEVAVVGAGHNGLVAATLLADAGIDVAVYERAETVGGAVRTEYPFESAPNLGQSTGAYLLGVMPPELIDKLDVTIPTIRRDPHYFLPTSDGRYLALGSDEEATRDQFEEFFSLDDWEAYRRLERELEALREDLAPAWLRPPLSLEATADRYIRPDLRESFVELCRGSIGDYLDRFGFDSELLQAMYAVTDGFTGCHASWETPGSGMNFLIHNMCRLPGSGGTWMVVRGGMGTVTQRLAEAASSRGARIRTDARVDSIRVGREGAEALAVDGVGVVEPDAVLVNADPFTMRRLVGRDAFPEDYNRALDRRERDGTTLKINLCLEDLPTFEALPERRGQHQATIHILPQERPVRSLQSAMQEAMDGRLPEFPSIEWYVHTTLDPALQDAEGRHSSALFVQWVPYELEEGDWETRAEPYARHLLSICDRFAPGTSELVEDMQILPPPAIESHFGMHRGHIHHIDNTYGFDDRHPYRTPIPGLYSCSAGCHPGGSVIGAAGHNAAMLVEEAL